MAWFSDRAFRGIALGLALMSWAVAARATPKLGAGARTLPITAVTLPLGPSWSIDVDTLRKGLLWDELRKHGSGGFDGVVSLAIEHHDCKDWQERVAKLPGVAVVPAPGWLPPGWLGTAGQHRVKGDLEVALCVDAPEGHLMALVRSHGSLPAQAYAEVRTILWRVARGVDAQVPEPPPAQPIAAPAVTEAHDVDGLLEAGRYRQALDLTTAALHEAEGQGGWRLAHALVELGRVEDTLGLYRRVDEHAVRARDIVRRERASGSSHVADLHDMLQVAEDLPTLQLLLARGYEERHYFLQAQKLAFIAFGKARSSIQKARALRRYGEIRLQAGDFEGAHRECDRAFYAIPRGDGPHHLETAATLMCLGAAKGWMNSRWATQQFINAVRSLQEKVGTAHPATARAMLALAGRYAWLGNHRRAARLLRRVREQAAYALGADSRLALEARLALFDNAHLSGHDREAAAALPSVDEAARLLGPDDPFVGKVMLAHAHRARCIDGDFNAARTFAKRAVEVYRLALRPGAPTTGRALHVLAELDLIAGDTAHAKLDLDGGGEMVDRSLPRLLGLGSDEERRVKLDKLRELSDQAVDLYLAHAPHDAEAARIAYETVLRRKGKVLTSTAADVAEIRAGKVHAQAVTSAFAKLAGLRDGYASTQLDAALSGRESSGDQQELLVTESIIAMHKLYEDRAVPLARWTDVQAALRDDTALVEIARYRPLDVAWRHGVVQPFGREHYVAFVVLHGAPPVGVDLGDEQAIDGLVSKLREAIRSPSRSAQAAREVGQALYRKLFAPIVPALRGRRSLLVSLAGQLHLAPLAALVDGQGNYLVESTSITRIATGRDLVRAVPPAPSRSDPVVLGNPDFGVVAARPSSTPSDSRAFVRIPRGKIRWPALPGTQAEVDGIAAVLPKARVLTGDAATVSALYSLKGPRVLHLATHGFFFAAQPSAAGARGLEIADEGAPASRGAHRVDLDRMLLSGLAFADADESPSNWLTALQAQSLDLYGTKLVVLSACETGLGKVKNGEGVYGLGRALTVAGAETLVMSLWKVDDRATASLMRQYYRGLVAGGGRTEALRRAQLAAIASPATSHPYYWAAFFSAGDPRSLDGKWVEPRLTKTLAAPELEKVAPGARGCMCYQVRPGPAPRGWLWVSLLLSGVAICRLRRRRLARAAHASCRTPKPVAADPQPTSGRGAGRSCYPRARRVSRCAATRVAPVAPVRMAAARARRAEAAHSTRSPTSRIP